jgi:hypothetical protein
LVKVGDQFKSLKRFLYWFLQVEYLVKIMGKLQKELAFLKTVVASYLAFAFALLF